MEWTKADTLKFIEIWHGLPCLWDSKCADYKHRQKRRDALSHLAREMGTDISAVEKKIVSIKTQFNRELSKLKIKPESGLDSTAQSRWYAFEYLYFLTDINIPRPSMDPLMCTQNNSASMEWTKADTLKFIDIWQGFPCLWNSKCNEYRHKESRRDALSHLAQEMGTDINFVEKKIISLKTQFNREVSKFRAKSGAAPDEIPRSSWYAFEYLYFLKDINIPRPSIDTVMVTKTENEQLEEQEDDFEENTIQHSYPRSKRKHDQSSTLNLLKDASKAIINKQRKDEFSVFGETIASELRDVNSRRHLIMLKKEIMDLVYRKKLEILDSEDTIEENVPEPFGSVEIEYE